MKRYSEKELYGFVWRADTKEKISIAEKWLKDHFESIGDVDLWDDLMVALSQQSRQLSAIEQGRDWWF